MSTNTITDTSHTLKTQSNPSESKTQNNGSIEQNGHIYETKSNKQKQKQKKLEAGKLRIKVVDELMQTEKTYVECLDNLIKHFMIPLQTKINGKKLFLSPTEHQTIFPSDINTIYGFHSQLLIDLTKVHTNFNNNSSKIGHIFVKYGQLFKMYQNYMNNHEKASCLLSRLKDKNSKFHKWCFNTRKKCNKHGLDSLLILPIQRIPRYQLLLKELIKRTEQYDIYHTDLYDLRNAFDSITEVTTLINDRMKENDRRQKVTLIETRFDRSLMDKLGENLVTPARYFIAESANNLTDDYIIKHNKHGTQSHIVLFIFNDCLIYGHYDSSTVSIGTKRNSLTATVRPSVSARKSVKNLILGRDLLKFDHLISFDEMFRLEDVAMQEYKNLYCVKIYGRQHSLWISFKTKQCKFKWITLLIQTNEKAKNKTIKTKHKYNIDIPYPLFVPDDYSIKCLSCTQKFSLINRRHHCYYCGTLACSKCTDYRLKSAWKKNEIVRVCNSCHAKYKDESGDVPPATLPSHHRASVWEASNGYNLNNYEPDSNIVPILSPSVSPVLKGMPLTAATPPPVYNINNELGTESNMNELVNKEMSMRIETRRRKMSEKRGRKDVFDIDVLKEITPIQTPKVMKQEMKDEKVDSYFKYEFEKEEVKNNEIELKDEEEYFMVDELDDIDDEYKMDYIDNEMKEKENEVIEDVNWNGNNMKEIDKINNDINDDVLIVDDNQKNQTHNMLIIGGMVVVGIAILVALKRKRFCM